MDITLHKTLPRIQSPPSLLFAYPSRVADAWSPRVEKVIQDPTSTSSFEFEISVNERSTSTLEIEHWTQNPIRRYIRRHGAPINLPGIVYDARWEAPANVTHLLSHVATPVLLARKLIREVEDNEQAFTVLVSPGSPGYVKDMLNRMGLSVVVTDREVQGQVLRVEKNVKEQGVGRHYPIPSLFACNFEGYDPTTPKRVFLSRKASRTIANETDIEGYLAKEGFHKCYFEDLTVPAQWSTMRNAEEIVGIHGAALGQLLFHLGHRTGRGPKLVEVFSAGHTVICFRHYIASQLGTWCGVRSRITSEMIRDMDDEFKPQSHAFDSIHVDVGSIAMALDYVRCK